MPKYTRAGRKQKCTFADYLYLAEFEKTNKGKKSANTNKISRKDKNKVLGLYEAKQLRDADNIEVVRDRLLKSEGQAEIDKLLANVQEFKNQGDRLDKIMADVYAGDAELRKSLKNAAGSMGKMPKGMVPGLLGIGAVAAGGLKLTYDHNLRQAKKQAALDREMRKLSKEAQLATQEARYSYMDEFAEFAKLGKRIIPRSSKAIGKKDKNQILGLYEANKLKEADKIEKTRRNLEFLESQQPLADSLKNDLRLAKEQRIRDNEQLNELLKGSSTGSNIPNWEDVQADNQKNYNADVLVTGLAGGLGVAAAGMAVSNNIKKNSRKKAAMERKLKKESSGANYSFMSNSALFSTPRFSELTPAQKAKLTPEELAYLQKQEEKEMTAPIEVDTAKQASRLRANANALVNISREARSWSNAAGSWGGLVGGALLGR